MTNMNYAAAKKYGASTGDNCFTCSKCGDPFLATVNPPKFYGVIICQPCARKASEQMKEELRNH